MTTSPKRAGTPRPAVSGTRRLIEERTIDVVPAGERHGRPRDLFSLWFAANISPLTIVSGTIAPVVYGLGLWPGMAAVVLGNLAGGFLMALHAAQGPRLGVPQLIQSRGQFGSHGALLVTVLVVFMYAGWFASNLVIAGQSLHRVVPAVSTPVWLVLCACAGLVVATAGYDLIHRVGRWSTLTVTALLAVCAVRVLTAPQVLERAGAQHGFTLAGFAGMTATGILLQIAYAPYVSDYTRYMPADAAGRRSTLWFTYWGCVLGSVLPMLLGVVMGLAVADDTIGGLDAVLGGTLSAVVLFGFALVVVHVNSMNLYGTALCLVTSVQTFRHRWLPGRGARAGLVAGPVAAGLVAALAFEDSFLTSYTDFLSVLQYVLIPWTAINLVDFYLIHRGDYDVDSFFAADGGVYGRFRLPALLVYAASFVLEIPFMHTSAYTGPAARALGGTDLAWAVGLLAATTLYGAVMASPPATKERDMSSIEAQLCETAALLLRSNRYLTLGTASPEGIPWAVPVTYAWDGRDRFYWYSAADSLHSRNIAANPAVSIVVFDSRAGDADGQALYGEGTAETVPGEELAAALDTFYTRRYPDARLRARKARRPAEFEGDAPKRMYRAVVHAYSVLHPDKHPAHGPSVPYRIRIPFTTAGLAPPSDGAPAGDRPRASWREKLG